MLKSAYLRNISGISEEVGEMVEIKKFLLFQILQWKEKISVGAVELDI